MGNFDCTSQRVYYVIITFVLSAIMALQTITLGTFSDEYNHISAFWKEYGLKPQSESRVCVIYGSISTDGRNPTLTNAPLCSVVLLGLCLVLLALIAWIIAHIVMNILGRPQIISKARIVDLIISILIGTVSLLSSVLLTIGFKKTCSSFPPPTQRCSILKFVSGHMEAYFYNNLMAATVVSWIVTLCFILLSLWHSVLLFSYCCSDKKYSYGYCEVDKQSKKDTKEEQYPLQPDVEIFVEKCSDDEK